MIDDSSARVCAAACNSDDVSVVVGNIRVCVEITNTDNVSVVCDEVGVNKTDEYIDCLPPVYAVVSVNITNDAPVVIGKVEAVITVNMIVDESEVETAEGVCSLIIEIDTKVFETDVTLTDDSIVVEDDKGDSISVPTTD